MIIFSVNKIINFDHVEEIGVDTQDDESRIYTTTKLEGFREISDPLSFDTATNMLTAIFEALSKGYDIMIKGDELDLFSNGKVVETLIDK